MDPFSVGVHIYLGRTGDVIFPVAALLSYLAIRPKQPGQLLIFEDGSPLTRAKLVVHLHEVLTKAGVNTAGYSGHSIRNGAASAAARAGLSDSFIQTLGRWKSSAFLTYLRTPVDQLTSASAKLV